MLDHNYTTPARSYLTGHHGLVTALLIALVSAVEVPVTDVLPGDPETARVVLLRARRGPALVVRLVLLAVVWKYLMR